MLALHLLMGLKLLQVNRADSEEGELGAKRTEAGQTCEDKLVPFWLFLVILNLYYVDSPRLKLKEIW